MTIAAIDGPNLATGRRSALLPFQLAAGLDIVLGLDLMLFGAWAADLFLPGVSHVAGLEAALFVRLLGGALLLLGIETLVLAEVKKLRRYLPAIPAMSWACVAASLVAIVLWHGPLSGAGIAFIAAMAAVAAGLAFAQGRALRAAA